MKFNIYQLFALLLIMIIAACATPQFVANPTQEAKPIPNTNKLSIQKGNIIINAGPVNTPAGLGQKITTIEVTLVNPTSQEVHFFPKDFLLFNQQDRQFYPLHREALTEAALSRAYRPGPYHLGYGFYDGPFYHHYYRWGPGWYSPSYGGRSYQGLIAKALPLEPITIYPNSTVSGYLYYPVSPTSLDYFRVVISRFTERPTGPEDLKPSVRYEFSFTELD